MRLGAEMKKIEMGKKYRTRDGRDVRILCVDRKHEFPVVGLFDYQGEEHVYAWMSEGFHAGAGVKNSLDLVEVSPYADIPIDAPGWARDHGREWVPRYFAGVSGSGKPMAWVDGATSFSTICGRKMSWTEFTTTKPEGVE